jgi:cytochrome c oxidase cbb3-type subunit 3
MDRFRWVVAGIALLTIVVVTAAITSTVTPGTPPRTADADHYGGAVAAGALLRVPVTGIYPGGRPTGLNPDTPNPLQNDPDAVQRGMKDFDVFNCSGCHAANGGGGMGPSLSNDRWIYRSSPANIYLTIVQGRSAGMPAFGAMLPDRTVWELVAYIKSISQKPGPQFGTTISADIPAIEQIPANQIQSAKPWDFTEPMPPDGERNGKEPSASPLRP